MKDSSISMHRFPIEPGMEELGCKGKRQKRELFANSCMLFWDGSYYIYFTAATSTAARVDVYTNHVGQMDEPLHATNEMPCAIESNTFHLGAGQLDGRKLTIWEHGGRPSSPRCEKKR